MLRISNPTAYQCVNCGTPAVLVEFATGVYPVHCGTYRHQCPVNGSTVSDPPGTGLLSPPVWIRDALATVATQLVEQFMGLSPELRDRISLAQQLYPARPEPTDPTASSADGTDQNVLVAIVVALIPPQLPRRLNHGGGRADA